MLLVVILGVCMLATAQRHGPAEKLVLENRETLAKMAREIIESGNADGRSFPGVRSIRCLDGAEAAEFLCGGRGLGSATSCYGFYYFTQSTPESIWSA